MLPLGFHVKRLLLWAWLSGVAAGASGTAESPAIDNVASAKPDFSGKALLISTKKGYGVALDHIEAKYLAGRCFIVGHCLDVAGSNIAGRPVWVALDEVATLVEYDDAQQLQEANWRANPSQAPPPANNAPPVRRTYPPAPTDGWQPPPTEPPQQMPPATDTPLAEPESAPVPLYIDMTGPRKSYLHRPADWTVIVKNLDSSPLRDVVIRDQLPPELEFVSAGQDGTLVDKEVVWRLGTLQPGEQRIVEIKARGIKMTPKALNVAWAVAEPGDAWAQVESTFQIAGLAAFRFGVEGLDDPVEAGGKTSYRIEVLNNGTLPGTQVEIRAVAPKEMRVTNTAGPTQADIDGSNIVFAPVAKLPPGEKLTYTLDVEAMAPGAVRFQVELRAAELREPVIEEESTTILDPSADDVIFEISRRTFRIPMLVVPRSRDEISRLGEFMSPRNAVRPRSLTQPGGQAK